jgi:hypothetical protein|tara:strand:+ start:23716 stop:24219 length:504 start_codon:yes stop_codon:yes gene_type:complete
LKILVVLLLFLSFNLKAQDTSFSVVPKKYSIGTSFQNEDIFVSLGVLYPLKKNFTFEFRFGLGSRRTFFQQTLFSKTDLLLHYDFLKSTKWEFGPSVQFSNMSLAPRLFQPIQRYFTAELGYYLAYGHKLKVTQSSYLGYRSTEFVPSKKRYWYTGYAFQLGLSYEL